MTIQAATGREEPVVFECQGERCIGIHHPGRAETQRALGVVVVVGGPQYRIGSHRQFLLLARRLAASGYPVLRFDYRGMGDSEGDSRSFESIGPDIRAAIEELINRQPHLDGVVLWGLCDAASAITFYARTDSRIRGLTLLNPWVHTEAGAAEAYLKTYYIKRLFSRDFFEKVMSGGFEWRSSLTDLAGKLIKAVTLRAGSAVSGPAHSGGGDDDASLPLPARVYAGLATYPGRILLVLSGNDLTAAEFRTASGSGRDWKALMRSDRVTRRELAEADHTFSRDEWRTQVENWTLEWLEGL